VHLKKKLIHKTSYVHEIIIYHHKSFFIHILVFLQNTRLIRYVRKAFVAFAVKTIDKKELSNIEIEEKLSKNTNSKLFELTRDKEIHTEEIDQFRIQIFLSRLHRKFGFR